MHSEADNHVCGKLICCRFFSASVFLHCWDSAVSHTSKDVVLLEIKVAQWHDGIVQCPSHCFNMKHVISYTPAYTHISEKSLFFVPNKTANTAYTQFRVAQDCNKAQNCALKQRMSVLNKSSLIETAPAPGAVVHTVQRHSGRQLGSCPSVCCQTPRTNLEDLKP